MKETHVAVLPNRTRSVKRGTQAEIAEYCRQHPGYTSMSIPAWEAYLDSRRARKEAQAQAKPEDKVIVKTEWAIIGEELAYMRGWFTEHRDKFPEDHDLINDLIAGDKALAMGAVEALRTLIYGPPTVKYVGQGAYKGGSLVLTFADRHAQSAWVADNLEEAQGLVFKPLYKESR